MVMKKRKLISLLCAAALSASSFGAFVFTANAEETTLWSDTFNGYENFVDYYHDGALDYDNKVLVDGTLTAANEYAGIEGIKLVTTNRADDSSYFQLTDDEGVGKALTTQVSRFSTAGRGAQIQFNETYAPENGKDLVLAFKAYSQNPKETTFDNAVQINGLVGAAINLDSTIGEWKTVKVVITSSGATAYIGEDTTPVMTSTEVTNLSSITFKGLVNGADGDAQKASSNPKGYPIISIDDVVVYTTDAGNGLASTIPQAETKGEAEIEYEVVPVPEEPHVPKVELTLMSSDNFNDETPQRYLITGANAGEGTYTKFETINLMTSEGGDARGESNWSSKGNPKTDPSLNEKYLVAANGNGSTANRGPKLAFKKKGSEDEVYNIDERETVVVTFVTRLHAGANGPAELIFSGDLVAGESKGNLASPIAMITTDADASSSVYAVDQALTQGGENVLQVEDNKWVTVKIEAYRSEGKAAGAKISVQQDENDPVYIFGSEDSYADIKDNTKSGVSIVPYISFRSGNSDDYGVSGSLNDIDNISIYSSQEVSEPEEPADIISDVSLDSIGTFKFTSSEAVENAVIARVSSTGLVSSSVVTSIAAGENEVDLDAAVEGDKVIIWDSYDNMNPILKTVYEYVK